MGINLPDDVKQWFGSDGKLTADVTTAIVSGLKDHDAGLEGMRQASKTLLRETRPADVMENLLLTYAPKAGTQKTDVQMHESNQSLEKAYKFKAQTKDGKELDVKRSPINYTADGKILYYRDEAKSADGTHVQTDRYYQSTQDGATVDEKTYLEVTVNLGKGGAAGSGYTLKMFQGGKPVMLATIGSDKKVGKIFAVGEDVDKVIVYN